MKYHKHIALSLVAGTLLSLANLVMAAPLFFENFQGADEAARSANVSAGSTFFNNWDSPNTAVPVFTYPGNSMEVSVTGAHWWDRYGVEYPKNGTLTWDTTQHKYIQAFIPNQAFGGGNNPGAPLSVSVDGGPWIINNDWYWYNHTLSVTEQWYNHLPRLVDVNTAFNITPGVHTIKFRFMFAGHYGTTADFDLNASMIWIKGGMSPSADITIATYKDNANPANPTPHTCGLVSPDDGTTVPLTNRPRLQWTAPDGFTNLSYILVYSMDPHFAGPTTKTHYGLTQTSFDTEALAKGKWYWTVIPVNSDDIAGQALVMTLAAGKDWYFPNAYIYPSFVIDQDVPVELSGFSLE